MMKIVLLLFAVSVLGLGITNNSYAVSPLKQLKDGITVNEIQCDTPNHVLVMRSNNSPACVTERTSERMGWEIINSFDENNKPFASTQEKIPNPTGYWIPIPEKDREDFAKKFANAAGDVFIEKSDKDEYVTENGKIDFYPEGVYYHLQDLNINNKNEQKEFVSNFMESMEFEYDELDFTHSSRIAPDINYYGLFISNDVNKIGFAFNGLFDGTIITFNGWTNNLEIIVFPLSEELSIQKAIDFTLENVEREYAIANSEAYNSHIRECNLKMFDDISASKYIISGLPYYDIFTGHCDNGMAAVDWVDGIKITLDGQTGEEISWRLAHY